MTTETGIRRHKGRKGLTLVEAMLAVVVLAIAAAGVLLPFVSGATVQAEGVHRTLGAELASNLMEQIIKTPFNDIVDSYNYTEPQGQVKDMTTGVPFTDLRYANFGRKVTCEYVAASPQTVPSNPAECNFILITVQVDYSGKNVATLSRLVSK
jgi:prepilin-type N-terminal cleavage/methylation domain-containing protein